jgi:hypothetical protein
MMGSEAHLNISEQGCYKDPQKQKRFRLCKLFLRKGGPKSILFRAAVELGSVQKRIFRWKFVVLLMETF